MPLSILGSILSLLLPLSAAAADPAICTTQERARDGSVVEGRTEIHYGARQILRNGVKAPFLADQRLPLPGVPALVAAWRACDALSDKRSEGRSFSPRMECANAVMAKHMPRPDGEPGLDGMARLAIVFILIGESAPETEGGFRVSMDVTRVASTRAIQLEKASKFGIPGLYEYFDARGALLGRFLVNTPLVLECR